MTTEKLRSQMIEWNIRFPLDREYRKKNNITFGSTAHRETNQVDIYLQFVEDKLFEDLYAEAKIDIEKEKRFKKGEWISEVEPQTIEEENDLFDQLDFSKIKFE